MGGMVGETGRWAPRRAGQGEGALCGVGVTAQHIHSLSVTGIQAGRAVEAGYTLPGCGLQAAGWQGG